MNQENSYNMPPKGLFGKRCRIKHCSNLKRGFVYRIVNDGVLSNEWRELPLGRFGKEPVLHDTFEEVVFVVCDTLIDESSKIEKVALKDIEIIEEEPSDDCISRQAVNILVDELARAISDERCCMPRGRSTGAIMQDILDLPPVNPQETVTEFADRCRECGKMKRCKDCKHFEYDSVAKVDGVPLIVAHEICSKWGNGCKTREDGYCFLFESKEEGIKHG